MKLMVLGATGPSGVLLCRQALKSGHQLVVYVRNPSKLPKGKHPSQNIATHDDAQVVTGQLTDLTTLSTALEGCNAVVSALGPYPTWDMEPVISNGYKVVLEAMRVKGIKRIIALGSVSIAVPDDIPSIVSWLVRLFIHTTVPGSTKDNQVTKTLFEQTDDLDWTWVRVPFLTSKPGAEVIAGFVGDGNVGWALRREAFARFVIDELEKREWVRQMPTISNA